MKIKSSIPAIAKGLGLLYGDYPVLNDEFADFHITVEQPRNWRRYIGSQVVFQSEGVSPFNPLPYSQAFPMLEWGMNWCISSSAHSYLIIHAAVLEKNGLAIILAAPPGSGKSTLCAALMLAGWRLLSDELTLIRLQDGLVEPLPRPVSLKNASIGVISALTSNAQFSPAVRDTVKGTVAHMKPTLDSVQRANVPVQAAWICFPKYRARSETRVELVSQATAALRVAENCFNYGLLGLTGFHALTKLVQQCNCYDIEYSDMGEALIAVEQLPRPENISE